VRSGPLLVPVLLAGLGGCRSHSPEEQVRAAFEACRAAVEAGDAAAATAPLDPAFAGPEGLDRASARMVLVGLFRQGKVGITVFRNEVTVRGGEASQEVDLVLTQRGAGPLPEDASRRSFRLLWRRTSDQWRLRELQAL